jgi:hypothetical protein
MLRGKAETRECGPSAVLHFSAENYLPLKIAPHLWFPLAAFGRFRFSAFCFSA